MAEFRPQLANILIIDDQEHNISLLKRMLVKAGFQQLYGTQDPFEIDRLLDEVSPDIILLDLHMPGMDGIEAVGKIRSRQGEDTYLPILMLTADNTSKAKQEGLQVGVDDFLTKPFDRTEVVLRIRNLLRTRFLHKQLQAQNERLEQHVRERTARLQQAQMETIRLLARASEYRDDDTGTHTLRVGKLTGLVAELLGFPPDFVERISLAATLHDIGKIGIPDHILLKPGGFDPEEFELMKQHTIIGANILQNSSFDVLKMAETIARHHHEKWDGSGYPAGLRGKEIPIEARIVALADFYDAVTHERPYKKAWSHEEAVAEIMRQRGKHFDPQVADRFLEVLELTGVQ